MGIGKHSADDNQSGMSKKGRDMINNRTRMVNQEVKRRLQQERPATNQDGNKKSR